MNAWRLTFFVLLLVGIGVRPTFGKTKWELAGELYGSAMYVDEFYRQSKCSRQAPIPMDAKADAMAFILRNSSRIDPSATPDNVRAALTKAIDEQYESVRKVVRNNLAEIDRSRPDFCSFFSGYFHGMLFSARSNLEQAIRR